MPSGVYNIHHERCVCMSCVLGGKGVREVREEQGKQTVRISLARAGSRTRKKTVAFCFFPPSLPSSRLHDTTDRHVVTYQGGEGGAW